MYRALFVGVILSFAGLGLSYDIDYIMDMLGWLRSDPDLYRNVSQLITTKGYPIEEHVVQTEDGYLLSVQRIPHGRGGMNAGKPGPAVFLQHGILSSSADWVLNLANESLGFILADSGYDVWLGNARGNTYSRHNTNFTPSSSEFWNFSFDEMAEYDITAMVDHVLKTTGQQQVYYIGHSQGTTMGFAQLSQSPEFNKKIKLFVALAPVSTVGFITSPIKYLAPFAYEIDLITELLGIDEFLPNDEFIRFLAHYACESQIRFVCENVMFLFTGSDAKELNATRLGVYLSHIPAGTSTKSIVHFGQLVNSKKFQKFDYGKSKNQEHYNQTTPPEYDVSKITTPVALLWALNDELADPTDVGILKKKLKSLVSDYLVPLPYFNHADFVLAVEAKSLVYDHVLELLAKYS